MTSLLSRESEQGSQDDEDPFAAPSRNGFHARLTDHLSVAVGTSDGLYLLSDGETEGPYFRDLEVTAFLQTGEHCYTATSSPETDPVIYCSDDHGVTWNLGEGVRIAFEGNGVTGRSVNRITHLCLETTKGSAKPVILAAVEPPAMFRSVDGGKTFEPVAGFNGAAEGNRWVSAPTGTSTIHSLITHPERPDRIVAGIAGAGIFVSDDGGATWADRTAKLRDTSRIAQAPGEPDALWAQTSAGTYHSEDAGGVWSQVEHEPVEPEAIDPLSDGGLAWTEVVDAIPHAGAHYPILRDAFAAGADSPFALAFGTQGGEVLASLDGGITWRQIAVHLPPVLCVRVLA